MDCNTAYEELARLAAGELEPEETHRIQEHLRSCDPCRRRLEALRKVDAALGALPRMEPAAGAILTARRLLSQHVRAADVPEIMTLEEVADFLRVSLDDLEEVVLELPAFELAGQLRVRRSRLLEWVEARERSYAQSRAQSEVARILSSVL